MVKTKRGQPIKKENVEEQLADFYLKAIKAGVYLVLFLPLVVIPYHLYLFQFGKVIIFRVIVEVLAVLYIFLILEKREYRPRFGLMEISIALFAAVYLVTSLAGVNFAKSFWGTVERMGGFFSFVHYWAFFIIASGVFKDKKDWEKLLTVSAATAVLSAFFAFGQRYTDALVGILGNKEAVRNFFLLPNNLRPFGTIGNAGLFAAYLIFNIFFSLYLSFLQKGSAKKAVYLAAAAIMSAALFLSGTRSAYLALIAGLALFVLAWAFFSGSKKYKAFAYGFLIVLVLIVSVVWLNKDASWVKSNYTLSRLSSISFGEETAKTRLWAWNAAWEGFKDKPFLGWGPENFNIAFNNHFNPLYFTGYGSETWFDRAHNIFLDILTTMGILGLAAYLAVFLALYSFLFKNRNRAREYLAPFSLFFSLPVAYFIQNSFLFDDFSTYLMLFLFLAFCSNFFAHNPNSDYGLAKISGITQKIKDYFDGRSLEKWVHDNFSAFSAFLIAVVLFVAYFGNARPWIFHKNLTLAVVAFNANGGDAFDWYKVAKRESTYLGREELYKRFGEYVTNVYKYNDFKTKEEQQNFNSNLKFALDEMKSAVDENPQDVQFYLLLGRIYNTYYSFFRDLSYIPLAENVFRRGLELSPERETLYYELGQTLIFKKDYADAIQTFKRAMDLNPEVAVSHWYLGMAYMNADQYEAAKGEIEKAVVMGYDYHKNLSDILGITSIYIGLKDYKKLEILYNEALKIAPDNPQIYASLALVYKELGDRESARKMVEKAISLDSSYTDEGKKFIDLLK